jgi:hypothetical protein
LKFSDEVSVNLLITMDFVYKFSILSVSILQFCEKTSK